MVLVVPLAAGGAMMLLQFTGPTPFVFTWKLKPAEGEGSETATMFVAVRAILSSEAPGE